MSTLDELAATLDNRQITDEKGEITEEAVETEESAPQDEKPEEEVEETEGESREEKTEDEPDLVDVASDEEGKRYVPEKRFKEVYAKYKKAERALNKAKTQPRPDFVPQLETQPVLEQRPRFDKASALETELLRSTLPQFNPDNPDYSRELDELGYSIYESSKDEKGEYTMTRLEAGRRAVQMARKITSKLANVKDEARTVKAQQSDQGVTSRVLQREGKEPDVDKMSLEEKEQWLRDNGHW